MWREVASVTAQFVAVAVPCWVALRVTLALRRTPERLSLGREAILIAAVLYGVLVAVITVVPVYTTNDGSTRINLVPFGSILECTTGLGGPPDNAQICIENISGNVLMFMPLGVFLHALSRRHRRTLDVIATTALIAAGIESVQFLQQFVNIGRTIDVDDVMWDVVGAVTGYQLAVVGSWMFRRLQRHGGDTA